jgi:hypothetical protein
MKLEIGAEAALFPEKEYVNGIAVAVWVKWGSPLKTRVAIWCASKKKKKTRKKTIAICRGQPHLSRSLNRIVCRGQKGPKGSKGILRPDFQANIRPLLFLKPVLPKETGRRCKKILKTVSSRTFFIYDAWTLWGQQSPLMNKKGKRYPLSIIWESQIECTSIAPREKHWFFVLALSISQLFFFVWIKCATRNILWLKWKFLYVYSICAEVREIPNLFLFLL